jgi:hypothetical protein
LRSSRRTMVIDKLRTPDQSCPTPGEALRVSSRNNGITRSPLT